jgi:ribosomal protein S18 acetylase RimI-like enzyme
MVNIRPLQEGEEWFLREMLYEAIFIPAHDKPLPESVVDLPELAQYIVNFGRQGDICMVAEQEGILVGAAWSRLFSQASKGYGFVDEQTPEMSMAIKSTFRGQGTGTQLIAALLQALQQKGYQQLSLSVDKRNRAMNWYKQLGFEEVAAVGNAYTMVKQIIQKG